MIDEITALSSQFKTSDQFSLPDYRDVIIAGMGGSGIAGMIFSEIYGEVPARNISGYHIPKSADEETVFIGISYSGNTEETISCFREAERAGCKTYAITSGGMLSKLCKNTLLIPGGLQPRSSVGYLLTPLIRTFCSDRISDLEESSEVAAALDRDHSLAQDIAGKIVEAASFPVVMGYPPFASIAYRWQTQFNENAKMMAFSLVFPELDHNAIVGLGGSMPLDDFFFMHFGGSDQKISKRIGYTIELSGISSMEIPQSGSTDLGKAIHFLHFGDYLSYFTGLARKVDPREVNIIEKLKYQLSQSSP